MRVFISHHVSPQLGHLLPKHTDRGRYACFGSIPRSSRRGATLLKQAKSYPRSERRGGRYFNEIVFLGRDFQKRFQGYREFLETLRTAEVLHAVLDNHLRAELVPKIILIVERNIIIVVRKDRDTLIEM